MTPELGWTKEMLDEIKDCEIDNEFSILIKIQNNYYEFEDKERDDDLSVADTSPISYKGIFSSSQCYDDLDGDYDPEKYKLWGQVDISIIFYDRNTRKFDGVNSEAYKYGFLAFRNLKNNDNKPALTIGINKDCGIEEKINDLFIKSKIFNHNNLDIDIYYDCQFIKDIEYDKFFTDNNNMNLVPIKAIILNVRFGLDRPPYVIVKE